MDQQLTRFASKNKSKPIKCRKTGFESTLKLSVDNTLSELGHGVKEAIYQHFEFAHNIRENEIPFKIEEFFFALEKTFGSAAQLIEIRIIENLHKQENNFKFYPARSELSLIEYVKSFDSHLRQV